MNYTILPISVIDVGSQKRRKKEDHDLVSSRANYSPFPDEVCTLCVEYFLRDAVQVFDPFAGWGERNRKCADHGKKYIGYDTSTVAIDNARSIFGVANTNANSLTADIPKFDGMITCPPYWNLEVYSGDGLDKAQTWEEFLVQYQQVFARCYHSALPGATFCVMVCDWRSDNRYYDLEYQTQKIFTDIGAEIFDKVVVSRSKISKIKVMLPQAKRLGYTVKVHEVLMVFKKPNTGTVGRSCPMFDAVPTPHKAVFGLQGMFDE